MSNSKHYIIITTTDEESNAEEIASHLISNKFAGCVQIDKIKSYYHWKAELQISNEYRLLIKAPMEKYNSIEKAILKIHNYTLPQIIKLDITGGFEGYLQWLDDSCESNTGKI